MYVVNVEEYINSVFVLKFHTKKTGNSKKKYMFLTNKFDARKIIFTCIQIGLEIFKQNEYASFGFLGSPTIKELKQKDKKLFNNKRFKVYSKFAKFFFSPDTFEHVTNRDVSSYLLLNKKQFEQIEDFKNKTIEHFQELYSDPEGMFIV